MTSVHYQSDDRDIIREGDTIQYSEIVEDDEVPKGKQFGTLQAFGIIINCIVGTGFFSVPNAYYHTGLPLSIGLTVLSTIFCLLGALWALENIARARGLDYARKHDIPHKASMNIFSFRAIEFSESSRIFAGKAGMIFCEVIFFLYALGSLWAYVSMFCSTTANLVMKYIVEDSQECIIEKDPNQACYFAYIMSAVGFAVIILLLELFDMSKLAFIQVFFTVYRFVAFFLIFLSCVITFGYHGAAWLHPTANAENDSSDNPKWYSIEMSGFPSLFSSTSFAFTCAYNLPTGLAPMKAGKAGANRATTFAILSAAIIYIVLAIFLSMALGEDILQYVILNWSTYGKHGFITTTNDDATYDDDDNLEVSTNVFSLIIKFGVMLFPMMNMISTYPLVAHSIGNAFFTSLPQHLQDKFGEPGLMLLRYLVTLPPFILAMIWPSLELIVNFCGLSSTFLVIFIPAVFQWYSKRICGDEWRTPHSGWWSHTIFVFFAMLYGGFALIYGIIRFVIDDIL